LQLVPIPVPQRLLLSSKFEQTSPPVQSSSLEQLSHSPPLSPQELIGSANARISPHVRMRFLIAPMSKQSKQSKQPRKSRMSRRYRALRRL